MRWLAIAAVFAALPISAFAAPPPSKVFLAPDLIGTQPSVDIVPVGSGAAMPSPDMTTPGVPVGTLEHQHEGTLDAPSVDAPPPATVPSAIASTPITVSPAMNVPPLDSKSAGAPHLTTSADVVAETRKMSDLRRAAAEHRLHPASAASHPAATTPVSGTVPVVTPVVGVPALPDGSGCKPGGDITQLLSPACLETLRDGVREDPAPLTTQPDAAQTTQCGLLMFGANGVVGSPATFQTSGLQECLAMASRMSYGVPGTSNITAMGPGYGLVAVTCKRAPPDGQSINCEAQR